MVVQRVSNIQNNFYRSLKVLIAGAIREAAYDCLLAFRYNYTIGHDTLNYFRAPKSWRVARLICRTEPKKTETVIKKN